MVESYGLELFDLQFRREAHGWVLRVVIDRPWDETAGAGVEQTRVTDEPVGIDDCGRVSRDLDAILDVEPELLGELDRAYTLEVSSPGLDRPLRGERDYRRFAGRLAKIVTVRPVDGQSHFAGRLMGIEDGYGGPDGRPPHASSAARRSPACTARRGILEGSGGKKARGEN